MTYRSPLLGLILMIRPLASFLPLLCLIALPQSASAMQSAPVVVNGQAVTGTTGRSMAPDQAADAKKSDDGKPSGTKPDDGAEKKAGEKDESKPESPADAPPKVIRRDAQEVEPANAEELRKAVLGDDGKVAFEFRNQTWPELIQWLSAISGQPIDWQELPGDRVNITTPGRYGVDAVQDLLNRHLLGRGYTLLSLDGGLTVMKCDSINPSLVPRVDEFELSKQEPHSFVRLSLDVGWLSAEKLAIELKPMMSKNGTLSALTTTNRIEAMDSAVTLRHIAELLGQERSAASRESLAPEFKLRHLPAEEAKRLLEQFLGIEKKKDEPMTPQQMQMMQQMRQQNQGQPPPTETKKPEISVVANNRQNSIIIMAPPDRIAIATEFLKRVDVPSSSISSLADIQNRVQVFRLASLDPEKLIEILQEMNILEPTTRTRVDNENRAIIVSGSAADRYIIDQLIQRLDGSGRQFEVLQLRRLDAGEVAESISFLMGQDKEEDNNSSRNRYSYYWGGGQGEEKKKEDKFRVAANTRFRQVLLWANELEMTEVRNLLVKLGELPPPGGNASTIRVIEASSTPETLEYLRRLKQQFNQIAPNELELPPEEAFIDPLMNDEDDALNDDDSSIDAESLPAEPKEPKPTDRTRETTVADGAKSEFKFAVMQTLADDSDDLTEETFDDEASLFPQIDSIEDFDRAFGDQQDKRRTRSSQLADAENQNADRGGTAAPIRIEVDSSGNLTISSSDTEALDRLEGLMLQFTPPQRPYRVFKVRHASASWMKLNLQDYFKDLDEKKSSDEASFFRWYFGDGSDEKKEPAGLGKGNSLRFIDDVDTNTIVVNGANEEQLKTIEELIALWDVPEPVNKRKTRFTRLLAIEFGKAEKIADTVKDAYRDLLSSNDKAFQQERSGSGQSSNERRQTPRNRTGNGSDLVDTSGQRGGESGGSDFTFKGKLSIGIDDIGNTLLISAEGQPLLELVCDMVNQLDEASRPSGDVQVVRLSGGLSGASLEAALRAFQAKSTATSGVTRGESPGRGDRARREDSQERGANP